MEEQEIWSANYRYLKLKYPKQKSDTQAIVIIILKLEQPESQWFYHLVMRHRDGMANSADQDQSAPVYTVFQDLSVLSTCTFLAQNEVLRLLGILPVSWFYHTVMHHRDGMANSTEPEQSALGLHCLPRPCRSTLFAAVLRVITIFYRYHGHNMAELLASIVYLCIVIKIKKIITVLFIFRFTLLWHLHWKLLGIFIFL